MTTNDEHTNTRSYERTGEPPLMHPCTFFVLMHFFTTESTALVPVTGERGEVFSDQSRQAERSQLQAPSFKSQVAPLSINHQESSIEHQEASFKFRVSGFKLSNHKPRSNRKLITDN